MPLVHFHLLHLICFLVHVNSSHCFNNSLLFSMLKFSLSFGIFTPMYISIKLQIHKIHLGYSHRRCFRFIRSLVIICGATYIVMYAFLQLDGNDTLHSIELEKVRIFKISACLYLWFGLGFTLHVHACYIL